MIKGTTVGSKTSLFFWKHWLNNWFDSIVDQTLVKFVRYAEEVNRSIASRSISWFVWLGCSYYFLHFLHFWKLLCGYFKHFSSRCKKNSGCKLSLSGALPAFSVLIAAITLLVEKSLQKSWSADGEFHSIFSSRLTFLVNSRFFGLNLPFYIRHEATAIGFVKCGLEKIFFLPFDLLIVAWDFQTRVGLVNNISLNASNKFERKISRKRAARAEKGFTLFIPDEDMNDIIKGKRFIEDFWFISWCCYWNNKIWNEKPKRWISWCFVSTFGWVKGATCNFFTGKSITGTGVMRIRKG